MFPLGLPEAAGLFSWVLKDDLALADGASFIRQARNAHHVKQGGESGETAGFCGFPEPFLKGSARFHRRWQEEYKALMIKEEVRDFSRVADMKGLAQLIELLPSRVSSP